jgi:glycosyltransferase involved in cell wall biosynthesis
MSTLRQIYRQHKGKLTDKWVSYLREYHRLFSPYRHLPVCLLEIGVQNGGSLEVWGSYFPNAKLILGCDINPACAKLTYAHNQVVVLVGDINTDQTEAEICRYSSTFDLIIDDGSHTSSDIIKSFARYFPRLRQGGLYVVEDLHCSYWQSYEGGINYPFTSMAFLKTLADIINFEHWGFRADRHDLLIPYANHFSALFTDAMLAEIHSVEFINSMCVIHKQAARFNRLGRRFVAGSEEVVATGHLVLNDMNLAVPDQEANPWAMIENTPAIPLVDLHQASEVTEGRLQDHLDRCQNMLEQAHARTEDHFSIVQLRLQELEGHFIDQLLRVQARVEQFETLHRDNILDIVHQLRDQEIYSEQQLNRLLQKIKSMNQSEILRLNKCITDQDNQILIMKSILDDRDNAIHNIFNSWSWRLSAPLRILGKKLISARKNYHEARVKEKLISILRFIFCGSQWPEGIPEISKEDFIMSPLKKIKRRPLISAIMPVYNACRSNKKYFMEALESISQQTYDNFELIIIDDGSTDGSRELYEKFYSDHPELTIKIFQKTNGGQSSARNYGASKSSGEYLAFIDQDDEWYAKKLEICLSYIQDQYFDMIYTDADTIDGNGNIMHSSIHQSLFAGWPHPKKCIEDILFKDIFVMPGTMIIKKESFFRVGGFDEELSGYEDDDLVLRLYENGSIRYIPYSTLRWRQYNDNYSFSHRMLTSRLIYWRKLLKNYTSNGADLVRVNKISERFFCQFITQAIVQFKARNSLYKDSINGACEIIPYLSRMRRIIMRFYFMLPHCSFFSLVRFLK